MTLHAADAATLLVDTAEDGGSAVVAIVVGGTSNARDAARIAWIVGAGAEPTVHGSLGAAPLDDAAIALMKEVLADPRGSDGLHELDIDDIVLELYLEVRRPVQELIIVGAGHVAQPLAHMGSLLGFRVYVLDDRPASAFRTPSTCSKPTSMIRSGTSSFTSARTYCWSRAATSTTMRASCERCVWIRLPHTSA